MPLDLTKVAGQVDRMVTSLKNGVADKQQRLNYALETLGGEAVDIAKLQRKIAASKTTWLVAGLVERLNAHFPAPPLPDEFTVMATDGSHIEVDRHQAARCYLINIGNVVLHYGAHPEAVLDSVPSLYAGDDDLVMTPPDGKGREQVVVGPLLGLKRGVDECRHLAELAAKLPPQRPALALLDGTLVLWGLEAYPEFITQSLLEQGFLTCLEQMRKLGSHLAMASYISSPRGTDVVNALRVAICPNDPPDCDRYCAGQEERGCEGVAGVLDQELFFNVLGQGERSALFMSQSSVVRQHYGEHHIYFFYLRVEDEIARVEVPQWVARDEKRLNLVHSLVLDQCRRGQGYPVALSEAHEQAVVREADRQNFWQLVESLLVEEHLPTPTSGKGRSKRTRWI
ncbi:MAG: DNA double-strand break repair nuclease NurA [Chloroflexota bacterium]